jgi:hypothetical protein
MEKCPLDLDMFTKHNEGQASHLSRVFLRSSVYSAHRMSKARTVMKLTLAIFCMLTFITTASAQYGVSNARDGNGNLIRDTGLNPARNFDQVPVNNLNNLRLPSSANSPQKPKVNGAIGIK